MASEQTVNPDTQIGNNTPAPVWKRWMWLLPIASFLAGVGSFFLVERQEWLAQWVVGFLILTWIILLAESPLTRLLEHLTGYHIPPVLLRYGTQALHQETLFFVIPFFIASTDWQSFQVLFTGQIILFAVISILDPIYFGKIGQRRWLLLFFHAFAIFVALLTALPIIFKLTTTQSLTIATGIMVLTAAPSLLHLVRFRGIRSIALVILIAVLLSLTFWITRGLIPPATLRMTESYTSFAIDRDKRSGPATSELIRSVDLQTSGLYAFSAIRAPRGLHEKVFHIWQHNGKTIDRIPLNISGGREEGFRAWSYKTAFPPKSAGDWEVIIETEGGQRIGRLSFEVSD